MNSSVYFAECDGRIKIGFSRNVKARMKELEAGNPASINVIATLPGGRSLESRIHADLAAHIHRNEWFNDCAEVRAAIEKYRPIANAEAAILREQSELVADLLKDVAETQPRTELNFWNISQRFSKLVDLDILDRISAARSAEKRLGLPRGTLMDKIITGDDRRKQFVAAVDLLLLSHAKFGKILDQCVLELGDDLSPYFTISEQLISGVEAAFAPFLE